MKLCGQISIELTVDDFVEAADHQKRLEGLLATIRASYPDATLAMRERRERKALALARAPLGDAALARYREAWGRCAPATPCCRPCTPSRRWIRGSASTR
jgi:hypothetical protein